MAETAADVGRWLVAEPIFALVGGNVLLTLVVALDSWRTRRLVRSLELRHDGIMNRIIDTNKTITNISRKTLEMEGTLSRTKRNLGLK